MILFTSLVSIIIVSGEVNDDDYDVAGDVVDDNDDEHCTTVLYF